MTNIVLQDISDQELKCRQLLLKAQEIMELLQRAVKLGYSITLEPEQMQLVITIFEEVYLTKDKSPCL